MEIINELAQALAERKTADPGVSYVASLYAGGRAAILEKIEEEAGELADAANHGSKDELIHESADLWFHWLVLLSYLEVDPAAVFAELERRFGVSGHEEKAARK